MNGLIAHHRRPNHIYQSNLHLAVTFFFVFLPLIALLAFTAVVDITVVDLLADFGVSLYRLFIAYSIAVVAAWFLAVGFYKGKSALIALPIFDVLQSFPTFALMPLASLVWGFSDRTIIFFLVFTIIWPILFSILSSLKMIKSDWEDVVKIYQLPRREYFASMIIPITLPGVITGSIIGLGEGWEALIATEIIMKADNGLGPFFSTYSYDGTITALAILVFLILIFSINKLIWLPLLNWSHGLFEQ